MPNLTAKAIESARPGDRMITIPDAATPGLELYVTRGGAKTFSIRYTLEDGTRRRMNLGRWPALGLADARQMALAAMNRVAKGEDPGQARKTTRKASRERAVRSVNDLAESFWEAAPALGLKASTLDYWRWLYGKHLQPRFGSERPEDLAPGPARRHLREIGEAAGPTTANRAHGLLRRLLNFGVDEEHLKANPLLRVKAQFEEKTRARVLTDDELKVVWAYAESTRTSSRTGVQKRDELAVSRALAIAVQLCAVTLQRGGEVIGMRFGEIDLSARTWLLPAERTKAGREQLVPLSGCAVELIEEAMEIATVRLGREPRTTDPVFPSPRNPEKAVERLSLTRAMARLTAAAGVIGATPHDLRRTGATAMASERISILGEVVARVLNHAPPGLGVTAIYNRHGYVAEKRRALEAWAVLLDSITSGAAIAANVVPLRGGHG